MKIILFGAQGVGKGTIGALLSKDLDIPLLGAGDMLREAIKQGTEVGKIAEKYVNKGELVPPDVIAKVVEEKLKKEDSYILDGYPRNLKQDELLDVMSDADFIFELIASKDLLLKRLYVRQKFIEKILAFVFRLLLCLKNLFTITTNIIEFDSRIITTNKFE